MALFPSQNSITRINNETQNIEIYFRANDEIKGECTLIPYDANPFIINNLKLELIGEIHTKNLDYKLEFIYITQELSNEEELVFEKKYPFSFNKISGNYESYNGEIFEIVYFLRVTLSTSILDLKKYEERIIYIYRPITDEFYHSISYSKIEHILGRIGTENIKIIFNLDKNKFFINEPIRGKIIIREINNIKISSINLSLIKNEKINGKIENYILSSFEMCDGQPMNGDIIPIRIYINNHKKVSITMKNINNGACWLRYYLKLTIILENENDTLFKSQEIIILRSERVLNELLETEI